ncbi:hypothetical protein L596_026362 [Steinernema carpocapsae]|uniref:Nucleotide-diphospho-sugar transferase domain-containing protein n=1 Tax=Steinernema carpocapsae TaxID=34508 RepID=A0A4U5M136_STECR|nr:hypothetical protein L596_026362 [Steinernema carpocapsae]
MLLFISRRRVHFAVVAVVLVMFVVFYGLGREDEVDKRNTKVYYAPHDYPVAYQRSRDLESNITKDVGILIIFDEFVNETEYILAIESMKCYAALQNYSFNIVRDSEEWSNKCNQTDNMMKRHCIAVYLLDDHKWTLFIDADVGVINPAKLIEEWVDDEFDVILYDRFYNWEVATGSYLVKRSTFAKDFLMQLANYKLPNSFHGTDNGAIHFLLAELLAPYAKQEIEDCRRIWNVSKTFTEVFEFEACLRTILGEQRRYPPRLKILKKGTGWVRDGWLTSSTWSPETDFMLHGWQIKRLMSPFCNVTRKRSFAGWEAPFSQPINQTQCQLGKVIWHYNKELVTDPEIIRFILEEGRKRVMHNFWKVAGDVAKYFKAKIKVRGIW